MTDQMTYLQTTTYMTTATATQTQTQTQQVLETGLSNCLSNVRFLSKLKLAGPLMSSPVVQDKLADVRR